MYIDKNMKYISREGCCRTLHYRCRNNINKWIAAQTFVKEINSRTVKVIFCSASKFGTLQVVLLAIKEIISIHDRS